MRPFLILGCFAAASVALGAQPPAPLALPRVVPTTEQILSLKRVGSPEISPDGRWVAYTVRQANWDENAYETQIWLADAQSGATRQLTNSKKSSNAPAWSPDGSTLAFGSDRTDKRQIYLINPRGGEAYALTSSDEGVNNFAWAPDGTRIAYTATEPKPAAIKDREKKYGEFQVIDQEHRMTHIFVIDVATKAARQVTNGAFVVGSFEWSPDGRSIAFDHRINANPANSATADISIVTVADGSIRKLVTRDGADSRPVWSPDGSRIAFQTPNAPGAPSFANHGLAVIPAAGGAIEPLTASFDENPSLDAWKASGIYFSASQHTWSYLYRLDPATKTTTRLAAADQWVGSSFTLSRDGSTVAFLGADPRSMAEVYVAPATLTSPRKLTDMNAQTSAWQGSSLEVVSWKSQDGTAIEGVLHKPADFDARHKYPLLVVIHGGPTGVSRPVPYTSSSYPVDIWVPRGALVLEPNYRGSAAYGEKFRALNVRNLGIGDAWDVLSGVDSLIAKGIVDPARVGTMGWSQGGYISAFLATHDSTRFKAISVGAGISDWMTYYVNTDIHPFTRTYLKATPWDDPDIYAKTSPITYIKQAKTPTLIQHGDADQRVPPPNAFELYQGLQDQRVPVKLIIYKGFGGIGHGPSKPKSYRAVMDHNLEWFDQYLFETTAKPTSEPQKEPQRSRRPQRRPL
jgi:dipeptidyl aminopeptidase/acylaminoacyl peptidase